MPVVAVTAITINGTAEDVANVEAEDSGQLIRLDASGCPTCWPTGRIVVEYTVGYVLPGQDGRNLPNDVERAAILLVKAAYLGRDRDPSIKAETTEGVGSTTYGPAVVGFSLPLEVEGLLSRYRSASVL